MTGAGDRRRAVGGWTPTSRARATEPSRHLAVTTCCPGEASVGIVESTLRRCPPGVSAAPTTCSSSHRMRTSPGSVVPPKKQAVNRGREWVSHQQQLHVRPQLHLGVPGCSTGVSDTAVETGRGGRSPARQRGAWGVHGGHGWFSAARSAPRAQEHDQSRGPRTTRPGRTRAGWVGRCWAMRA